MKEPNQYIFEEWNSMYAKANKSLHSACPLLEDEVLVEMHKYLGAILIENEKLSSVINIYAQKVTREMEIRIQALEHALGVVMCEIEDEDLTTGRDRDAYALKVLRAES